MLNIVIIKNEEQKFTQILKTRKQEVLKCKKDFNFRQVKAFVKNHFGPHWWAGSVASVFWLMKNPFDCK